MSNEEREEVVRISISLPKDLNNKLERVLADLNYPSRSKFIQDALEMFILEKQIDLDQNVRGVGAIVMIYEHHKTGIDERLVEIQHKFTGIIKSTMHVHLTHDLCFEIIVLDGTIKVMNKLAQELQILKGMRVLKLVISIVL